MTYVPDIADYQQLHNGDPYGRFDCTAWSAALVTDAHTQGKTKLTGTQVRAATDEAVPDPASPGLNLPQVDRAIYDLTRQAVNLDTRLGMARLNAQTLIVDGRWAIVQVNRGILVARGFLEGFSGGHALTVHAREIDAQPVLGDPLVGHYVRCTWDALWDAAGALINRPSQANVSLTRDLTPDYRWVLRPVPPATRRAFSRFVLSADGRRIVRAIPVSTAGTVAMCTPPRFYPWTGHVGRSIVQLTTGPHKGWWVIAKHAEEMVP